MGFHYKITGSNLKNNSNKSTQSCSLPKITWNSTSNLKSWFNKIIWSLKKKVFKKLSEEIIQPSSTACSLLIRPQIRRENPKWGHKVYPKIWKSGLFRQMMAIFWSGSHQQGQKIRRTLRGGMHRSRLNPTLRLISTAAILITLTTWRPRTKSIELQNNLISQPSRINGGRFRFRHLRMRHSGCNPHLQPTNSIS